MLFKRRKASKIYSKPQRHKTRFLPNRNTPQSPTATAPLLKRGQPIRCPTAVRKKKNVPPFRLAGSFRHAYACHLPPRKAHSDQLRCRKRKVCKLPVLKTRILCLPSSRHKAEKSHQQRLPPRGSCRGATEGACATFVFCCFRFWRKYTIDIFSNLKLSPKV